MFFLSRTDRNVTTSVVTRSVREARLKKREERKKLRVQCISEKYFNQDIKYILSCALNVFIDLCSFILSGNLIP